MFGMSRPLLDQKAHSGATLYRIMGFMRVHEGRDMMLYNAFLSLFSLNEQATARRNVMVAMIRLGSASVCFTCTHTMLR